MTKYMHEVYKFWGNASRSLVFLKLSERHCTLNKFFAADGAVVSEMPVVGVNMMAMLLELKEPRLFFGAHFRPKGAFKRILMGAVDRDGNPAKIMHKKCREKDNHQVP